MPNNPTSVTGAEGEFSVPLSPELSDEAAITQIAITAERPDATHWWAALWNGHQFEAAKVSIEKGRVVDGVRY